MDQPTTRTAAPRALLICAWCVLAIHILLPIGTSLPPLHLGQIPIHLPMVVYPFFLIPSLRLWPAERPFRRGLTLLALLSLAQLASLPFSERLAEGAYEWSLDVFRLMGCFLVAWYLVVRMRPRALINSLSVLLVAAATVGIFERLAGRPIWPYEQWYTDWYLRVGTFQEASDIPFSFRVWGTLGNPINYCSLMMLGLPWVASLAKPLWRWTCGTLLVSAAALTLSRTIVLFAVPFGCLALIALYRAGVRRVLLVGFGLSLVAGVAAFTVLDTILELWQLRLAFEDMSGAEGVSTRSAIAQLALQTFFSQTNPLAWLFGRGQGSGAVVAQEVLPFLDTIDNEYVAFLYQSGLIGLTLWLSFWSGHLRAGFRRLGGLSFHLWAVVGYLLCGLSFEIHRSFVLNLLVFLSVAWVSVVEVRSGRPEAAVEASSPD